MSIRTKTILATCASLIPVMALLFFATHELLLRSFSVLEERRVAEDVRRVRSALDNSVVEMGMKVIDWSAWDDTCGFIVTHDARFIRANLVDQVFVDQRFNFIGFFDNSGHEIFVKGYDFVKRRKRPITKEDLAMYTGNGTFLRHRRVNSSIEGLLLTPRGPMILVSQPIVTSEKKGPIRGTMVVGRFLSMHEILRLSHVTRYSISILHADGKQSKSIQSDVGEKKRRAGDIAVRPIDNQWIAGYAWTSDVYGRRALLLRVLMPRDITAQGRRGARTFYVMFLVLSLGSTALILIMLERVMLAPLGRLVRKVQDIGRGGDPEARLQVIGSDELASLATAVNSMLDDLEVSHHALAFQEALAESEERYRRLTEMSPDAVFILSEAKVVFINAAALLLIGESASESVIGRPLTDFIRPDDAELFGKWVNGKAATQRIEMMFIRNDGSIVYLDLASIAYVYQGRPALQIVAHDDTERIRSGQRLSQANEVFLSFGPNPNENIERLTTLCGEMMNASFAFYCRMEGGLLQTIGRWNTPEELPLILPMKGSAVYESTRNAGNNVIILKDIPGENKVLSGDPLARSCGINTLIVKSVQFQNDYIGTLCAAFRMRTTVAEEDKKFMTIIAGAVGVEEKRRLAEIGIQHRLETEKSISAISSRFMSAEDMDYALNATLEDLGELSDAKRVALFVFDEDGRGVTNMAEWFAGDVGSRAEHLRSVPLDRMIWCLERLRSGDVVEVHDQEATPPEAAAELRLLGGEEVLSMMLLPLHMEGRLAGFIAFSDVGLSERLSGEDIALMRVTSEIIGNALSRKGAENRLKYLAYHDAMTDLPNRSLFNQMLEIAVSRARVTGDGFAVLLIDINRFKDVNDLIGHAEGDKVLKTVAQRIKSVIRGCDFLARHSGDEFIAIVEGIGTEAEAEEIAMKMVDVFDVPFTEGGHTFYLSTTIGVCMYPSGGETAEDIVMNADMAMSRAKEPDGTRGFELFTAQLRTALTERKTLENELHDAIERNELVLYYQPQVEIATGTVMGAEALIRWEHPRLGLLSPIKFIPIAEDSGLIVPIGEWVMRTACEQNQSWREDGLPLICVAVNLSARQFLNQDLRGTVRRVLDETGIEPQWLELEITESIAMVDIDATLEILGDFHKLGVQLSIDDFGTGYSSLSYLRSFPVDTVKIAGAFLHDVLHNSDSAAIVQAIITLAHTLRRRVIAEEVETREQIEFLRGIGCDEVQGYYYSRPLVAERFETILRSGAVIRP